MTDIVSAQITRSRAGTDHRHLRVAIAHEWLVRYAGSERCVDEMLREFPDAQLLTTVVDVRRSSGEPPSCPPVAPPARSRWRGQP